MKLILQVILRLGFVKTPHHSKQFSCFLSQKVICSSSKLIIMATREFSEFPTSVLQPRAVTGAAQFLVKYPEHDGRGTIIAILDSGIDPAAGGLQVTSDGKPKVIERIDASGCGDVDMSKEVEAKDGIIEGLTTRSLVLPNNIVNPSGKFRIGVKRAFCLYPKSVKERMIKERQETQWDPIHKQTLANISKKLLEFESMTTGGDTKDLVGIDKLTKEDLDAQTELLLAHDRKFRSDSSTHGDLLPVYDVLSYHDGNSWNVIIDNTEKGDLENAIHLKPFSQTQQFAPLCSRSKVNVSVNVHDDGKIVEIVSMCSSHGTHVASIAAANFPDAPEKNGLAPGAQIISISIGDGRLESMETGTAIIRACIYIMQRQENPDLPNIDVINMSYGEQSHWSTSGRVGQLMSEVVDKYGVIWVASVGNEGPALSTISSPPDVSTSSIIGVGAYVSPEMMLAMYSNREKLPGTPFTWSSRGPTQDGDRGITICAPGGAITSVPQFTLSSTQLMNGTSMASPHVCGAVSLLTSGLKQRGILFSPYSIKRAIAVSAKTIPGICNLSQGNGLLQVESSFDHLLKFSNDDVRDIRFLLACPNGFAQRGVYLRSANQNLPTEVQVKVEPVFINNAKVEPERKIGFHLELGLTCQESWVRHPSHLNLVFSPRNFNIHVDPTGLEPGVHSTFIKAFDVNKPDKGTLFEIPVTVVKPEVLSACDKKQSVSYKEVFAPGAIKRHFYVVPEKSTYAIIQVVSNEKERQSQYMLHTVQLVPKKMLRALEKQKNFTLQENGEFSISCPVKEGGVVEICLAKWWSSLGNTSLTYTVTFMGAQPDPRVIVMHASESIKRIDVTSRFSFEVHPEIKLKNCINNYRPTSSKIVPLGNRDVIPDRRTSYELQLSYNFSIAKATEITPNFPLLSDVLYESEFDSQMWMLYNSQKQLIAIGDAYPHKWSTKVEKDDFVLRAHVRSERRDLLERLNDLSLTVTTQLPSQISLEIFNSFSSASIGEKKASSVNLNAGTSVPLYISLPPINEKNTKNLTQGAYFSGNLYLMKDDLGRRAESFPVQVVLNELPKRDKSGSKKSAKDVKSNEVIFAESLIEHKISWLSKLDPKSAESIDLVAELSAEGSKADQVQLRLALLQAYDLDKKLSMENLNEAKAIEALSLADSILSEFDENELLAYAGLKTDNRSDAAEIKKEMDKKKNNFIDALQKRGLALCFLGRLDEATDVLYRATRLVDATDTKLINFSIIHAEKVSHYGRALKLLTNLIEAKQNSPELDAYQMRLMELLKWSHCVAFNNKSSPARFPVDYELF